MSTDLPLTPQLTQLLNQYTSLTLQLFGSLSTLSAPPSDHPSLYVQLSTLSSHLSQLLLIVQHHTHQKERIHALLSHLSSLETEWTRSVMTLSHLSDSLKPLIEQGQHDRGLIESAESAQLVTPSNLLAYGRRLAPFTSAPPGQSPESALAWGGGGTVQTSAGGMAGGGAGVFPPFPTEQAMRRGRLQFDAMGGANTSGETETVGVVGEVGEVGAAKGSTDGQKKKKKDDVSHPSETEPSTRLMNQAKLEQQRRRQDEDEFAFDLDLNPDL